METLDFLRKKKPFRFTLEQIKALTDADGKIACTVVVSHRDGHQRVYSGGKGYEEGTHENIRLTPEQILEMERDRCVAKLPIIVNPTKLQAPTAPPDLDEEERTALAEFRQERKRVGLGSTNKQISLLSPDELELVGTFREGGLAGLQVLLQNKGMSPTERIVFHEVRKPGVSQVQQDAGPAAGFEKVDLRPEHSSPEEAAQPPASAGAAVQGPPESSAAPPAASSPEPKAEAPKPQVSQQEKPRRDLGTGRSR